MTFKGRFFQEIAGEWTTKWHLETIPKQKKRRGKGKKLQKLASWSIKTPLGKKISPLTYLEESPLQLEPVLA